MNLTNSLIIVTLLFLLISLTYDELVRILGMSLIIILV